jgi:hypothetical protein
MAGKYTAGQELKTHGLDMNCYPVICHVRFDRYLDADEQRTYTRSDGTTTTLDCVTVDHDGVRVMQESCMLFE